MSCFVDVFLRVVAGFTTCGLRILRLLCFQKGRISRWKLFRFFCLFLFFPAFSSCFEGRVLTIPQIKVQFCVFQRFFLSGCNLAQRLDLNGSDFGLNDFLLFFSFSLLRFHLFHDLFCIIFDFLVALLQVYILARRSFQCFSGSHFITQYLLFFSCSSCLYYAILSLIGFISIFFFSLSFSSC